MRRLICLTCLVVTCIILSDHGYSLQQTKQKAVGYFTDGPVQGLSYKTPTQSGITGSDGRFEYLTGETISFSVGDFLLGSGSGAGKMTSADLVSIAEPGGRGGGAPGGGAFPKINNRAVINMARFIQSLDKDGNIENGIVIDAAQPRLQARMRKR